MQLYSYYRSSCSWRIRIVLEWKDIEYEYIPVNLLEGQQSSPDYTRINPSGLVPSLGLDNGEFIGQSMAIMEYLEECFPEKALLPKDSMLRAKVRQAAMVIACDTQPLQNLRVIKVLGDKGQEWAKDAIHRGLTAFMGIIGGTGRYCFGESVTFADVVLIPQLYNARRFNVDLGQLTRLIDIESRLMQLQPFIDAAPDRQPDCPKV